MILKYFLSTILLVSKIYFSNAECIGLGLKCNEDCECCGAEDLPPVKCELRNKQYGRRCYKSGVVGDPCVKNADCRSGKCGPDGKCIQYHPKGPKPLECPMQFKELDAIVGRYDDGGCGCTDPSEPSFMDLKYLTDGDTSTSMENAYSINGGLQFSVQEAGSVRTIQLCNSLDCPDCDPCSYKLIGYCAFKRAWEVIQTGDLTFTGPGTCIDIVVGGMPYYTEYKMVFPETCGQCTGVCDHFCQASPFADPPAGKCPGADNNNYNSIIDMNVNSTYYDEVKDETIIYYSIETKTASNLDAVFLSWTGDCVVDRYYVYKDINGNRYLDSTDICCFYKCGIDFVHTDGTYFLEEELCMSGLEIFSEKFYDGGLFFVKLYMDGRVGLQNKQYGALDYDYNIDYGTVLSPKCKPKACVKSCPLKLSSFTVFSQCNEIMTPQ